LAKGLGLETIEAPNLILDKKSAVKMNPALQSRTGPLLGATRPEIEENP
jgi:hypothetical protein